jgi:8-oxo-dGTP diphosphatase
MDKSELIEQELMSINERNYLPNISVDCVVLGFHENSLKVLLLKWKNIHRWALPGGFVKHNEHVDDAAQRILRERTGLNDIFLQQFYTFGGPKRSDWMAMGLGDDFLGVKVSQLGWLFQRFISLGYYALVEYSKVQATPDLFSDECSWADIDQLPNMILDHQEIVLKAVEALRVTLHYLPIGINLLPEKFTMPELQSLYETILGRSLDRRNFQKKILSMSILKRLDERKSGGAHKSPYLYRFEKDAYFKILEEGKKGDI